MTPASTPTLEQAARWLLTRLDAASVEVFDSTSQRVVCQVVREEVCPFGEDGDAYVLQFEPHEVWRRARGIRFVYKSPRVVLRVELPRAAPDEASRIQGEIEFWLPIIDRAVRRRQ